MPGVRAISRRPKMKQKHAMPEVCAQKGKSEGTARSKVMEQQGQRLQNSKAGGYRTARPEVTEQQGLRLQNSKA